MSLDARWTAKTWDVECTHKDHNLEITDTVKLKVVVSDTQVKLIYRVDGADGDMWAECEHVQAQDEPEIREHLKGTYKGTPFQVYLVPCLMCVIPEDEGEGGYTSWTALEGAG